MGGKLAIRYDGSGSPCWRSTSAPSTTSALSAIRRSNVRHEGCPARLPMVAMAPYSSASAIRRSMFSVVIGVLYIVVMQSLYSYMRVKVKSGNRGDFHPSPLGKDYVGDERNNRI